MNPEPWYSPSSVTPGASVGARSVGLVIGVESFVAGVEVENVGFGYASGASGVDVPT